MGSLFNRGTKAKPRWVMQFKEDGRFVQRPSKFKLEREAEDELEDIESRIRRGEAGWVDLDSGPTCGEMVSEWLAALANRNAADDRSRATRHLLPYWKHHRIAQVRTEHILEWLDLMAAGKTSALYAGKKTARRAEKLSSASQRANLNLMSRFLSWCVERGHTQFNAVKQVPTGRRPQQATKGDAPWLDDDAIVRKLIAAMPEAIGLMFYLGNRSGLRTGEAAGLRMANLDQMHEGHVVVRYTYDGGFLKEDKRCSGLSKYAPAPDDFDAVLSPWLVRRKAQGAGPHDLVFPRTEGRCAGKAYDKGAVENAWDDAAETLGVSLTWYQATRHSFVTRSLKNGASLDEVSSAVGHSSPVVTRRYYDHLVRRTFSPVLRAGLASAPAVESGPSIDFAANLLPSLGQAGGA